MAEELVVQWRDLLSTAGIDVGVYVIEPHLLLLDTNDKGKVIQIKDFIVREAPGGEEHVECEHCTQIVWLCMPSLSCMVHI
jgi:hypothetical protein